MCWGITSIQILMSVVVLNLLVRLYITIHGLRLFCYITRIARVNKSTFIALDLPAADICAHTKIEVFKTRQLECPPEGLVSQGTSSLSM